MTDDENFFIRCLDDLRGKIANGSDYEILRGTGILRSMFLDSPNLVHEANRRVRVPLVFRFKPSLDKDPALHEGTIFMLEHTNLRGVDPANLLEMKLDQWLKTVVAIQLKRNFTVRAVIDVCANCLGGVHRAPAKNDEQRALGELLQQFGLIDLETGQPLPGQGGIAALAIGILQSALLAMEPIEAAIKRGV